MPNEIVLVNDKAFPKWDLYEDGLTQTIINKFLHCREKLRLSEIEGLRPISANTTARDFGSVFHDMVAAVRKAATPNFTADDAIAMSEVVLATMAAKAREDGLKDMSYSADAIAESHGLARATMIGYWKYRESDFAEVNFVKIEESWQINYLVTLGGKKRYIPLQGKFDGIFQTGTKSSFWLWETKTKGKIDTDLVMEKISFDLQVCMYMRAMKEIMKADPEGVRYDLIRKSQLQQGKNQTLADYHTRVENDALDRQDFYYERIDSILTPDDIARWKIDFDAIILQIVRWFENMDDENYRNSAACTAHFGKCEYLPICSRRDTSNYRRRDTIFPELNMV